MVRGDVTLRRKRLYLEALAKVGVITYAAKVAGISRQTVYEWLEADPDFARRHQEALLESTERMEQEAWRRAVLGTTKPIYYRGRRIGTLREHSDTLLIFMLKARKPETYRERVDVDARVKQQVTLAPDEWTQQVMEHLTDDDLSRLASALLGPPSDRHAGSDAEPR